MPKYTELNLDKELDIEDKKPKPQETTIDEYLRLHELRYKIITNEKLSDEEADEHQKLQRKHEEWLWSIYNESQR